MIEIIDNGPEKFGAQCDVCGCKYTYEVDDIRAHITGISKDQEYFTVCPRCGAEMKHHYFGTDLVKIDPVWKKETGGGMTLF